MTFTRYRTDVDTALRGVSAEMVMEAAKVLDATRFRESSVFILGNGGSAATASHFAGDLAKACGLRAFALPDMVSLATAYGNDDGWEDMYAGILRKVLSPFDVVVGISCSGNSENVVESMVMARHYRMPGIKSIGLIGWDMACGVAQACPDVLVSVPWKDIRVQEDCHLVICHSIVELLSDYQAQTKGVL